MIRSFHHRDFATGHLVQAKRGRLVSVCLPARDEAATVGEVVEDHPHRAHGAPPADRRAGRHRRRVLRRHRAVATAAGADVVSAAGILPEYGTENGKGQALWKGVHITSGDLVVFCDTDVRNFGAAFRHRPDRPAPARATT